MARTPIKGPVYLTSYALSYGILVFKDGGEVVDDKYFQVHTDKMHIFENDRHWTTDRDVAIQRYQDAITKKLKAANRAVVKLEDLRHLPTPFKDA